MDVGERIRAIRKSKGLTQIEVAEKAGIAVNSLRLYEAGKRMPNLGQIQAIAAALDGDVSYLVCDQTTTGLQKCKDAPNPVAPVKHGRWLVSPEKLEYIKRLLLDSGCDVRAAAMIAIQNSHCEPICSVCGKLALLTHAHNYACSPYCPHCGAKMDLGKKGPG